MVRFMIVLVLASLAAGCGTPATSDGSTAALDPTAAAMCAPGHPDCVDTVVEPTDGTTLGDDELRQGARSLLGAAEEDLPPGVRIGRRGDEQMALTEDYQVGRMTVELDQDVDSIYRVTSVTVELEAGPKTITAE